MDMGHVGTLGWIWGHRDGCGTSGWIWGHGDGYGDIGMYIGPSGWLWGHRGGCGRSGWPWGHRDGRGFPGTAAGTAAGRPDGQMDRWTAGRTAGRTDGRGAALQADAPRDDAVPLRRPHGLIGGRRGVQQQQRSGQPGGIAALLGEQRLPLLEGGRHLQALLRHSAAAASATDTARPPRTAMGPPTDPTLRPPHGPHRGVTPGPHTGTTPHPVGSPRSLSH